MDDFQESEFEQTLNWNLNRKVKQRKRHSFHSFMLVINSWEVKVCAKK